MNCPIWTAMRSVMRYVDVDIGPWEDWVKLYRDWQQALTSSRVRIVSPEMAEYMCIVVNMTEGRK